MMKTVTRRSALGLALILCLAMVGSTLGRFHWAGDLLSLVADYYLWLGLLPLLVLLLLREWHWAGLVAIALTLHGWQLLDIDRVESIDAPNRPETIRLMMYNIYYQNQDLDAIISEVEKYDPDILFLMEYSETIANHIGSAFASYPYQLVQPSRMTMGLALYSRLPLGETTVHRSRETRIPVYDVQLEYDWQIVTFVAGHPWPPLPQWAQLNRDQMLDITAVAAAAEHPLIVAGDFNASQWSFLLQDLAERANVRQVRAPLDFSKTFFPNPVTGLPLDHLLLSPEWAVVSLQQGQRGGSDHIPLVIDLYLQ
jgi:endonuclease/exonuclease/phosphatase (EEP) superfamily protein YafD